MGLLRFNYDLNGKALNDVNLRENLIFMGESVVSGEDFPLNRSIDCENPGRKLSSGC